MAQRCRLPGWEAGTWHRRRGAGRPSTGRRRGGGRPRRRRRTGGRVEKGRRVGRVACRATAQPATPRGLALFPPASPPSVPLDTLPVIPAASWRHGARNRAPPPASSPPKLTCAAPTPLNAALNATPPTSARRVSPAANAPRVAVAAAAARDRREPAIARAAAAGEEIGRGAAVAGAADTPRGALTRDATMRAPRARKGTGDFLIIFEREAACFLGRRWAEKGRTADQFFSRFTHTPVF